MASLMVLTPVAPKRESSSFPPAARVTDLRGKKIGLYDNDKPGGAIAQQRLIDQLHLRFEGLTFERYKGVIGGRGTLTGQGARDIAAQCDAVVGIRGD